MRAARSGGLGVADAPRKRRVVPLLALSGLALLVLPWMPWPSAAPPDGRLRAGGPELQALEACAAAVEDAAGRGAVQTLRGAVTAEHLGWIVARLQRMDRRLSPVDLKEQGEFHGDATSLPFLAGAVLGARAVMVRGRAANPVTGLPGLLRGWRFVWDGWRWRLDAVQGVDPAKGDGDLAQQAEALLVELLRG